MWPWNRRARAGAANDPDRLHLGVSWSIPPDFGGLPQALLTRTRLLAAGGARPQVLTFHLHDDLDAVRTDLVRRGLLPHDVPFRNLWDELRSLDDEVIRSWELGVSDVEPSIDELPAGLTARRHQVTRPDGSLLAEQLWIGDYSKPALDDRWGDRCVASILYGRDGAVLARTAGTHRLHHAWLDHVIDGRPATLVADDAAAVDVVSGYRRDRVATAWVVHGNHLKRNRRPPFAGLSDWRKFVIEHRQDLDATVFLTRAQRDAADLLVPAAGHHEMVIGHAVDVTAPPSPKRDPARGLVVGRLVVGKRVDHVIDAAALLPDDSPVHIDVLGSGPDEQALRARIDTTHTGERVRLCGYVSDVAAEYARAGFMVLASAQEAFGLVILEAMAAGCIPIAYDAPYGSSELIENGVNGFLVPNGNRKALAEAVVEASTMDDRRRRAMQKAGARTVADRSVANVTRQWLDLLSHLTPAEFVARPSAEQVDERERIAGRIRSERATVRPVLTDAHWSPTRLQLQLEVGLSAAGPLAGRRLDVQLVDTSTGRRRQLRERSSTVTDAEGVATIRVDVTADDLAAVQPGHDSVVIVGVSDDDIRYEDTVRVFRPAGSAAPVPLAPVVDGTRVTVHRDRAAGLTLRRPRPRVHATADLDESGLTITPTVPGPQAVRISCGSDVVVADRDRGDAWVLALPPADGATRSWTVEARDDTGWTKVALATDEVLAVGARRFELRTTEYGYLRLEERQAAAVVTSIGDAGAEIEQSPGSQLFWLGAGDVRVPATSDPTTTIAWPALAAGRWNLVAACGSTISSALVTAHAQAALPLTIGPDATASVDAQGRLILTVR